MPDDININVRVAGVGQATRDLQRVSQAMNPNSGPGAAAMRVAGGDVGATVALRAMAAAPGPVKALVAVVVTATAAIAALMGAARNAAEALMPIARLKALTGGTPGELARLQVVGGAMGIGDVAGAARGFRDRLANDPMAQAGFGAAVMPREFDPNLNEAQLYLRGIAMVLDPGISDAAAKARAVLMGLEEALPLRNLSQDTREAMLRQAQAREAMMSPEHVQAAVEFQARMQLLQGEFQIMGVLLQERVLPLANAFLGWLLDLTQLMTWAVSHLPGGGKVADAQRDHIQALNRNTQAIGAWREEFAGGGPRAQNAVPAGIRGPWVENEIRRGSVRLGAFEL